MDWLWNALEYNEYSLQEPLKINRFCNQIDQAFLLILAITTVFTCFHFKTQEEVWNHRAIYCLCFLPFSSLFSWSQITKHIVGRLPETTWLIEAL